MTSTATDPGTRLTAAASRIAAALSAVEPHDLADDRLLQLMSDASEARHALDLVLAAASAEVARRSCRDRGDDGLAQRQGHRTSTSLLQHITGQTRADISRALRTGEELTDAAGSRDAIDTGSTPQPPMPQWRSLLRDALAGGNLGQAQFDAIRRGLGEPPVERYPDREPAILQEAWAEAVETLITEAETLPVEELRAAARTARDRLDPVGVTLRFEERFAARSFRMWIDEVGQKHGRFVFDDEAAAWVQTILHAALRPRRGPRFVDVDPDNPSGDETNRSSAHELGPARVDDRSNEQLHYDTLVAVLRAGADADPRQAFGDRQPGVRILIDADAIAERNEPGAMRVTGVGHFETDGSSIPGGVVEKYLCDAGSIPVTFDSARRPLDVGREKRLFTRKQRIAIAARDGGCMWPTCTAALDWVEFHHIDHWYEDHGSTDVDDGIPLCRNCHLRLHNHRWRITRERDPRTDEDTYWLHPPPEPGALELASTSAPAHARSSMPASAPAPSPARPPSPDERRSVGPRVGSDARSTQRGAPHTRREHAPIRLRSKSPRRFRAAS